MASSSSLAFAVGVGALSCVTGYLFGWFALDVGPSPVRPLPTLYSVSRSAALKNAAVAAVARRQGRGRGGGGGRGPRCIVCRVLFTRRDVVAVLECTHMAHARCVEPCVRTRRRTCFCTQCGRVSNVCSFAVAESLASRTRSIPRQPLAPPPRPPPPPPPPSPPPQQPVQRLLTPRPPLVPVPTAGRERKLVTCIQKMKRRAREKEHEQAVLTRVLESHVQDKQALSACLNQVSVAAQLAETEQNEWWTARAQQYADELHGVLAEREKSLSEHEERVKSVELYLREKLRECGDGAPSAVAREQTSERDDEASAATAPHVPRNEFTIFDEFICY